MKIGGVIMNKALIIMGVIVLIIGIAANIYSVTTSESHFFGLFSTTNTSIPYVALAIPLVVGGMVLVLVGLVMKEGSEAQRRKK